MKRAGIAIPTVVLRMAAILMSAACGPSCLAQDATALLSAQRDQADTAQEEASAAREQASAARDQASAERAQAAAQSDLDAKLAAARERLEQAAREVAELSTQLGADARMQVFGRFGQDMGRAMIGLQLDPASGKEGARVLEVSPGGPAAEAGVRAGDIIVAVNGMPIAGHDTARKVVTRIQRVHPDTKVRLSIRRDGKTQELQLTTRPAFAFAFDPFGGPGPVVISGGAAGDMRPPPALPGLPDVRYFQALAGETAGMELANLTPALGWYFGTDKGVLVLRAADHDAFGLKDGDVILSIDGRVPQNGTHATRILRSYQPGEKITLKIVRQKRPMSLSVTLPPA
ncbi:MAG TPA: PDZ domain-containing protein [Steroidobacteraceae bacterium]|nr:PDZ domain-containing protein [Steroidobacteraceae bacterium]